MGKAMIKVSAEVDGKVVSADISEETDEILKYVSTQEGSPLKGRAIEWFLIQTMKKYKELTELNIVKFVYLELDVASEKKR